MDLSDSDPLGYNLVSVGKGSSMEDTGNRPGGLTALAVINIVFALILIFIMLGRIIEYVHISSWEATSRRIEPKGDVAQVPFWNARIDAMKETGAGKYIGLFVLMGILGILMFLSAIGYFKQKRYLGYIGGNFAAFFSFIFILLIATSLPRILGGGVNMYYLLVLFYAGLTLFLVNVTFRYDLVL